MNTFHQVIPVVEASQPWSARAAVRELAEHLGLDETDAHRAGLVATEMATNLVKHTTTGGEILIRGITGAPHGELELLAIDRGPGIRDLTDSLGDGYSTAGSPGTGLGAIRRQSDDFDIYSHLGRGTVVLARIRARRIPPPRQSVIQVGVVSVPMNGEAVCGDGWSVRHDADGATVLVADGLGHGVRAAEAARAAVIGFGANPQATPPSTLQTIHDALRATRGAAAAIAEIRPRPCVVKYAGVGNIGATILQNGTNRQTVSHNGTLGHEARYFREYTYPWAPDALIVMYSDGLTSHWSLDEYRGLRQRHVSIIAAVLYRDFSRQRDDVTVLVAREAR